MTSVCVCFLCLSWFCVKLFWLISFRMSSFWRKFGRYFVFVCVCFECCSSLSFLFTRVSPWLKQKHLRTPSTVSLTCRDLWMRENKCRNLGVLKSCCNEALKRKFFVITCNAICWILLPMPCVEDNIFARQTENPLESFQSLSQEEWEQQRPKKKKKILQPATHTRTTSDEWKAQQAKVKKRKKKLHWTYFGLVILA